MVYILFHLSICLLSWKKIPFTFFMQTIVHIRCVQTTTTENQPSPPTPVLSPLKHIPMVCQGEDTWKKKSKTNIVTTCSSHSLANTGLNHMSYPPSRTRVYIRRAEISRVRILLMRGRVFCVWPQILQHITYSLLNSSEDPIKRRT